MKHFHSIILACCIMMLAIATASADERRASDMFESTYVITGSDRSAYFACLPGVGARQGKTFRHHRCLAAALDEGGRPEAKLPA